MQNLGLTPLLLSALGSMSYAQGSLPSPPTPSVGSDWTRVQVLPPGAALHLNGHPHTSCSFLRADADAVTCGHPGHERVYPRAGIRSIKLAHRTRSTLAGLGIGAGTGAIIGFATGTRKDDFFGDNAFRGGITGVFAGIGGVAGAPVGYLTDFTAGSTIYRAP